MEQNTRIILYMRHKEQNASVKYNGYFNVNKGLEQPRTAF